MPDLGLPTSIERYTINYHDCRKPTDLQEINLDQACGLEDDMEVDERTYTILTPRHHQPMRGYTCSVVRSTFTYYCGAFSHTKILKAPNVEIKEKMDVQQCLGILQGNQFQDHYGGSHKISINKVNIFTVNERGVLHEDNGRVSCQGEQMKVGNDIVQDVLKLSQYKVSVIPESFIDINGTLKATRAGLTLPSTCLVEEGSCLAWEQTWVWRKTDQCPLVKIQQVRLNRENNYLVDHTNKLIFQKRTRTNFPDRCPEGEYYLTEYSSLYLTQSSSEFDPVTELDMALYINSRSDYLTYQTEQHLAFVSRKFQLDVCKNNYIRTGHEDEITQLPRGKFGKRHGDILFVFQCPLVTGEVKVTDTCYDKIPLKDHHYVDPATRLLVKTANEIDCRTRFPLSVKSNQGWIRVGPGVTGRPTPANTTIEEYQEAEHEDMSGGGLYNQQELESWETLIEWGHFKTGITESIANGLCKGSPECKHYSNNQVQYSLNNLITKAEETTNLFQKLKDFCLEWGGLLAFIILVKWGVELIVAGILVLMTMRHSGSRAARRLLFTLTCHAWHQEEKVKKRTYKINIRERSTDTHESYIPLSDYQSAVEYEVDNQVTQPPADKYVADNQVTQPPN